MSLFFDQLWFDGQLERNHLDKARLAGHLGLDLESLEMVWKDQRALTLAEVYKVARLFSVSPGEIMNKAGIATGSESLSHPSFEDQEIIVRLERIERSLSELKNLLLATKITKM